MRTLFFSLLAGLVLAGSPSLASAQPADETTKTVTASGFGRDPEKADERALEDAVSKVAEYLRTRYEEPIGWTAPEALLQPELLRRKGVLRDPKTTQGSFAGENGFKATYKVAITRDYLDLVHQEVREERIQSRQLALAKVLGGLVVLLVVVGGYLRLEEATRGYYTALLRITALGVLGLVLLVLLMIG